METRRGGYGYGLSEAVSAVDGDEGGVGKRLSGRCQVASVGPVLRRGEMSKIPTQL